MKLKLKLFVFFIYHSICYAQVEIVFDKSELKTIFIDSSQLKNEDCLFDKNFIGNLKSIQITKNEKKNLALLSLVDNKGETRLEFCEIIFADNEFYELEIDHSDISQYLSHEYFCLKKFKIDMASDEVSFYYFDQNDGIYRMFLQIK
ncbi:MAG: hypothetical protein ORN53_03885 [Crocinitomicaceae bacterium]|nr:hypothetical protein [Crocinitomicaceae bacterium]